MSFQSIRPILLTVGLLLPCLLPAQPALLFEPAPSPDSKLRAAAERRRARPGVAIARSRHVFIRKEAFQEQRLRLPLFAGVEFEADQTLAQWSADGSTFLWSGKLAGTERGHLVLAATGDIVSANISTDDGTFYWVRHVAGQTHVVEQVQVELPEQDDTRLPPEGALAPAARKPHTTPERLATPAAATDPVVVDILVAYTPKAKNEVGGDTAMLNRIQLGVTESNAVLANSNIPMTFRLVHAMEVNYNESSGIEDALDRLQSRNDGFLDELHTARNQWGADIVSLWIEDLDAQSGIAGIAYLMRDVSNNFEAWAFNVVEQFYGPGPQYAFPHEIGHNMGCAHDRANSRFYPTVAAVVATYYLLFAAMVSATRALVLESLVACAFFALAVVGFKRSLWLIVAALVGHAAFDAVHHFLIYNPGLPIWWPGFCGSIDVFFGGYLAVLLKRRSGFASSRVAAS